MRDSREHATAPSEVGLVASSLPYVLPLAVPLLISGLGDWLPGWRPVLYPLKVLATMLLLGCYRRAYGELRARLGGEVALACLVGLAVAAAWVFLDPYYPQSWGELRQLWQLGWQPLPHAAKVAAQLDPYAAGSLVPPPVAIGFRLLGAVLLAPVAEELFFRGWLTRFLVKGQFQIVPLGTFTWGSFVATTALFGLSHHEWLAGLLCGAALNMLLRWRRDLFLCMVAHAAANLALAVWVLMRAAWWFW